MIHSWVPWWFLVSVWGSQAVWVSLKHSAKKGPLTLTSCVLSSPQCVGQLPPSTGDQGPQRLTTLVMNCLTQGSDTWNTSSSS